MKKVKQKNERKQEVKWKCVSRSWGGEGQGEKRPSCVMASIAAPEE